MQSPEFFIPHIIDQIPIPGEIFERWPLHMTVVPPFEIPTEIDVKNVIECVKKCSYGLNKIELTYGSIRSGAIPIEIGNEAMFGEHDDIPVVEVLDPSGELHKLHSLLIYEIGRIGCNFINFNPRWNGLYFSPHATMKSGKKLDRPFFCTTLTLCKKDDEGKTVVDTADLCD